MPLDQTDQSSQDAWRIADRLYVGMRGIFGTPEQTPAVEDWGIIGSTNGYSGGYAAPTYDNWGNVIRQNGQAVTQQPKISLVTLALIAGGIYLLATKG